MNDDVNKNVPPFVVRLATVAVLAFVSVKIQRAAASPDFGRTIMMRCVWSVKRFADGQARFWQDMAGNAATKYNALKP